MTTYAVTGASGHFGRLAIEALIARGIAPADIVAIARSTDKVADLADRGVDVRHGDYDDAPSLDAALAGVDQLAARLQQRVRQARPAARRRDRGSRACRRRATSPTRASSARPPRPTRSRASTWPRRQRLPIRTFPRPCCATPGTSRTTRPDRPVHRIGRDPRRHAERADLRGDRADYADAAAAALIAAKAGAVYEFGGPASR